MTNPTRTTNPGRANATALAGITLSHPDKLYFPEAGITKADVARYYERMAPWLLPHVKGRPLSLVRCPDGWQGQCFYQKHADKSVNAAVDRIEAPEGGGTATYMGAGSAKALVALVQWGVIDCTRGVRGSRASIRPDRSIFDFDPDDGMAGGSSSLQSGSCVHCWTSSSSKASSRRRAARDCMSSCRSARP